MICQRLRRSVFGLGSLRLLCGLPLCNMNKAQHYQRWAQVRGFFCHRSSQDNDLGATFQHILYSKGWPV